VNLPSPEELDEATFMYVNHRWRELGLDLRLARGAVVHWRLRRGLRATWRQYFRYARGDAIAGMHPERHALRFAVYGGLAAALLLRRRPLAIVALLAGAAYAGRPTARAVARAEGPGDRAAAVAAVPALMALLDLAKMAGYVAGQLRRPR
jgi:hypothetical protein